MGWFHPIRSLLGVSELGETKSKNPFPEMRYFSSTSKKWKQTDAGLLFSLVQVSLGWQREWKLFWTQTQTLQDPPLSHLSPAAIPATGIVLFYLLMHLFFFFLFFNFTRKTQLASLKCESEQICSPTETHDRGERKNLQMQIFVPWSFKEKPRETRRQESEVHQVCNKQLAATDKRHLVHSIQALQHKIEQLIC